jgi:hypothetical protein
MKEDAFHPAIQRELKLGKYTSGFEKMTIEQVMGLLWLLGEWSCRDESLPVEPSETKGHRRKATARNALLEFCRKKLTLEEVKQLMREC